MVTLCECGRLYSSGPTAHVGDTLASKLLNPFATREEAEAHATCFSGRVLKVEVRSTTDSPVRTNSPKVRFPAVHPQLAVLRGRSDKQPTRTAVALTTGLVTFQPVAAHDGHSAQSFTWTALRSIPVHLFRQHASAPSVRQTDVIARGSALCADVHGLRRFIRLRLGFYSSRQLEGITSAFGRYALKLPFLSDVLSAEWAILRGPVD